MACPKIFLHPSVSTSPAVVPQWVPTAWPTVAAIDVAPVPTFHILLRRTLQAQWILLGALLTDPALQCRRLPRNSHTGGSVRQFMHGPRSYRPRPRRSPDATPQQHARPHAARALVGGHVRRIQHSPNASGKQSAGGRPDGRALVIACTSLRSAPTLFPACFQQQWAVLQIERQAIFNQALRV